MSENQKDHIDRLLDEGLKHYSRVEPPEDFAARVRESLATRQARMPVLRKLHWWLWAPVPAGALAMLLFVLLMPQAPTPQPPSSATTPSPAAAPTAGLEPAAPQAPPAPAAAVALPTRAAAARPARAPVAGRRISGPRALTPEELARLTLPADLFPKERPPEQLVIPDLSIPALKIAPLESTTQEPKGSLFDVQLKEKPC